MQVENPGTTRLHIVSCLDEREDCVEIVEILTNRRTGGASSASAGTGGLTLVPGTPVVRGPGWPAERGAEDGGAGNIGYVVGAVPPLQPSLAGYVRACVVIFSLFSRRACTHAHAHTRTHTR